MAEYYLLALNEKERNIVVAALNMMRKNEVANEIRHRLNNLKPVRIKE